MSKTAPSKLKNAQSAEDNANLRAHRTGAPRKKVRRLQAGRIALISGIAALVIGAGGGGWWTVQSGSVDRVAMKAKWSVIAAAADVGFRVDDILVTGRSQTAREDLLQALNLSRGAPMFGFDPHSAQERVENLAWVKSAVVERMLPATVVLTIREREPLAIWQNKGNFALIDKGGDIILKKGLGAFADLPLVVGDDAPQHAEDLIQTLNEVPQLMRRVKAAVRVGGRRWNLRLDNGIDIQLPEGDPGPAWARLAEYQREHKVLERDVRVLDLRYPDRLIVRKTPRELPPKKPQGQQT